MSTTHDYWTLHIGDSVEAHVYYPATSEQEVREFYSLVCPTLNIYLVEKYYGSDSEQRSSESAGDLG